MNHLTCELCEAFVTRSALIPSLHSGPTISLSAIPARLSTPWITRDTKSMKENFVLLVNTVDLGEPTKHDVPRYVSVYGNDTQTVY